MKSNSQENKTEDETISDMKSHSDVQNDVKGK